MVDNFISPDDYEDLQKFAYTGVEVKENKRKQNSFTGTNIYHHLRTYACMLLEKAFLCRGQICRDGMKMCCLHYVPMKFEKKRKVETIEYATYYNNQRAAALLPELHDGTPESREFRAMSCIFFEGKNNKIGRIEQAGVIRHKNVFLCAVGESPESRTDNAIKLLDDILRSSNKYTISQFQEGKYSIEILNKAVSVLNDRFSCNNRPFSNTSSFKFVNIKK